MHQTHHTEKEYFSLQPCAGSLTKKTQKHDIYFCQNTIGIVGSSKQKNSLF